VKFETWLLFVITEGVLSVTPGPAVLFVLSQGIRRGAGKSVWGSLGILSANAMYFALSATSVGALIAASYNLFSIVKWVGAAYLIYLGVQCFLSKSSILKLPDEQSRTHSNLRIWRDGFVLQGANPKALLFFTAILPQFIDPNYSIVTQVIVLGTSSIVLEFFILLAYGELAVRTLSMLNNPQFETISNRIAGVLLIGAGLGLARTGRIGS
jgi:threonine/homoserine/homoserine lactone efflux protein